MLTLDGKGRLTVPARWRDLLMANVNGQLVVAKNPDGCLSLYPLPVWEKFEAELLRAAAADDGWRRIFLGNAMDVDIDASSRVLIPPELRDFGRPGERDVMFIGMGTHFELWDAQRHAEHERGQQSQMRPSPWPSSSAAEPAAASAHLGPAARSGGCPGHSGRTASTSTARSAAAGMRARSSSGCGPQGRLIAFDRDPQAVAAAADSRSALRDLPRAASPRWPRGCRAAASTRCTACCSTWASARRRSTTPERGFSFRFDGPLDMRMDTSRGETAARVPGTAPTSGKSTEVIRDYGEERFALQIAKAIVARRESGAPVERTGELAEIVAGAVRTREPGQDPATRTFQALRILVNAELEELEQGLSAALALLAPGGRLAVISFHSLEDRIVKRFIAREAATRSTAARRSRRRAPMPSDARWAASAPARPKCAANPRARSAMLRVAERTAVPYAASAAGEPDVR